MNDEFGVKAARSTSEKWAVLPLRGGHSISKVLLLIASASISASTADHLRDEVVRDDTLNLDWVSGKHHRVEFGSASGLSGAKAK